MDKLKFLLTKVPPEYQGAIKWLFKYGVATYIGMQYGPAGKAAWTIFWAHAPALF